MADGDATYDAAAAPELVRKLRRRAARHGRRRPQVGGRGGLSPRPPARQPAVHRRSSPACSAAASPTSSPATGSSRAASSRSFPALSRGFETETEISVHALELAMPVGEVVTAYGARPEGSVSKLSTWRDGWRIMRTILHLFRIERPVLFYGSFAPVPRRRSAIVLAVPLVVTYLPDRPGAALPDRDPRHRPDDRRLPELLRRPDPRHGGARPARGAAAGHYLSFPAVGEGNGRASSRRGEAPAEFAFPVVRRHEAEPGGRRDERDDVKNAGDRLKSPVQ